MNKKNNISYEYKALDIIKFVATFLIVGSRALPLFNNELLNYYYGQWFFRFSVPLFFISSGFFYERMNDEKKKAYIKRIISIYVISSIIYIPLFFKNTSFLGFIYTLIFGYGHLWYLSSIIFALITMYIFGKHLKYSNKKVILTIIVLFLFGVMFDEYYKILNVTLINKIAGIINYIGGGRSFVFFALPSLLVGVFISKNLDKINSHLTKKIYIYFAFSAILSFIEMAFIRNKLSNDITADLTLFNNIPAILIFIISLSISNESIKIKTRMLRKMSDIIYIIHILVLNLIMQKSTINNFVAFIMCYIISLVISYIIIKLQEYIKKH